MVLARKKSFLNSVNVSKFFDSALLLAATYYIRTSNHNTFSFLICFPAQRQESLAKFELCSVPSRSFGVSFCLFDSRNPMGILGELPFLAPGRLRRNKISDG